jgi:hypothetical protein
MPEFDLHGKSIAELLAVHSAVIDELRLRKVLRSKNNPVGDYAEWLVAEKLSLTLAHNSVKGYDAIDRQGIKYQIKSRRVTAGNRSSLLGVIRNLDDCDFDFLVAVIFDEAWNVKYAAKIAHSVITEIATFRTHVNGHTMTLRESSFINPRITSITDVLRS